MWPWHFFSPSSCARAATAAVTFPLEAKWSATLPAPPAFAPAFDANRIYVPLQTKQLVALMISDGSVAWSVECPMTAPPAAGDGLVYAGSEDLIEAQGRKRRQRTMAPSGSGTRRLAALGHRLAVRADRAGPLLRDSRDRRRNHLAEGFRIAAERRAPAPAGDRLYLPLKDGRVVALSLQTGDEIWTHKLAEPAAGILPVGDRVFVGARDNQFHSLNAEDGDADWRWPTGADLLGLPVLDAKRVYFVALDNILRGHNRNNGSMMWKQVLPVRPFTGPLLSGETLIVAGVAAELHGYNALDGKPAGAPSR